MRCYGKEAFAVCSLMAVKLEGLCSLQIILDFILKPAAGKKIFRKEVWYTTWSGIKTLWSGSGARERNHLSAKYLWMRSDSKYQGRGRSAVTGYHTRWQDALTFPAGCAFTGTSALTEERQWPRGTPSPSSNAVWHLGRGVCCLISLEWSNRNGPEGMRGNWAC